MKNLLGSFDLFIEKISSEIKSSLPGDDAHFIMASSQRKKILEKPKVPKTAKKSAVLVLFFQKKGEIYTTLMKRTSYNGTHSGQISFPGGKKDPSDVNLESTALRELEEEIGINQNKVSIIGSISELYIPPSNFLVKPYLGYTEEKFTYEPNPREVEELIDLPLSHIFDDKNTKQGQVPINRNNLSIKAPYFDVYGHIVWGATAMIISELKEIIKNVV